MEDITLLEFIWNISNIISNWICSIKLVDYLFFMSLVLGWNLLYYILFKKL